MTNKIWWAIILIVLGILFWLGKFDIINFYWSRDWPVILIAVGIFYLVNTLVRGKKRSTSKLKNEILRKLENGEIDAEEAVRRLKKL